MSLSDVSESAAVEGVAPSVVVFVDGLDVLKSLRLLPVLAKNKVTLIRYRSVSRVSRACFSLLQRLGWTGEIQSIRPDYSAAMCNGGGLWYGMHAALLDVSQNLADKISVRGTFLDLISERIAVARRQASLRQRLAAELQGPLTLALFAQESPVEPGTRRIVCLSVGDLFPFVTESFARWVQGVEYVNSPAVRNWILVRILAFLVRQLRVCWRVGFGWIFSIRKNADVLASLAVQYSQDWQSVMSDSWWFAETKLDPKRLIVYFDRGDRKPATDAVINALEKNGHRVVIFDKASNRSRRAVDNFGWHHLRHVIKDLAVLAKWIFQTKRPLAWKWQLAQWSSVVSEVRKIQAFMERENVKVIKDNTEFSTDCAALAADIVGGIKIGVHWSDVSIPLANMVPVQHVYFAWGKRYTEVLRNDMGAASEAIVLIGNVFDNARLKQDNQTRGLANRDTLAKAGVKFVIGVFDRSCSWSSMIPPPYHAEFYDKLVSWAEADPSVGLIFKHKDVGEPRIFQHAGMAQIRERIKRLEKSGRLLSRDGRTPALDLSCGTDLVVSLGPNSAGVLCALAGVRSVFWDPAGLCAGPLREAAKRSGWRPSSVIFTDMSELIQAARFFLKDASAANGFGDFTDVLWQRDGFRDGKAVVRMGEFIAAFVAGLDAGRSSSTALDLACQDYVAHWGMDKCSELTLDKRF